DLKFVVPGAGADTRLVIDRTAAASESSDAVARARIGTPRGDNLMGDTDRAGLYEAWLTRLDGTIEVQRFAVNVDPSEGDLALADSKELVTQLASVQPNWRYADETQFEALNPANLPP